ncbi:ABC transporter permease [Aeromicrobium sp. CFBP 8757]|uniref:ABC transporter permease n=1 Tax=Aeromicrobium sp. CFBP 8757 TaxID=2775288 RepID=UPI00177FEE99|nr:ABC transporter permease [Aeromicrobium sp. CFBP 8757]MBD8608721.1 ABC transporter permease [Aeromicrobium sp. CFBP 8757]
MSTIATPVPSPAAADREPRPVPAPIPFGRLVSVELRKSVDTRAGFWLLASVGIVGLLATVAVLLWSPDSQLTYSTFSGAVGFPMTVLLPMIAILLVTGEWSQRSGLTTFTLVPHRARVIGAKAAVTIGIAVASTVLAFAIGAVGTVIGSAIAGVDQVWDMTPGDIASIGLAQTLGMLIGFMLAAVIRNSAGAIVAYFVYSFVLSGLTELLAQSQDWFGDLRPWVDVNYAQAALFDGNLTSAQWAHLAVTTAVWLVLPLAVGIRVLMRAEVK